MADDDDDFRPPPVSLAEDPLEGGSVLLSPTHETISGPASGPGSGDASGCESGAGTTPSSPRTASSGSGPRSVVLAEGRTRSTGGSVTFDRTISSLAPSGDETRHSSTQDTRSLLTRGSLEPRQPSTSDTASIYSISPVVRVPPSPATVSPPTAVRPAAPALHAASGSGGTGASDTTPLAAPATPPARPLRNQKGRSPGSSPGVKLLPPPRKSPPSVRGTPSQRSLTPPTGGGGDDGAPNLPTFGTVVDGGTRPSSPAGEEESAEDAAEAEARRRVKLRAPEHDHVEDALVLRRFAVKPPDGDGGDAPTGTPATAQSVGLEGSFRLGKVEVDMNTPLDVLSLRAALSIIDAEPYVQYTLLGRYWTASSIPMKAAMANLDVLRCRPMELAKVLDELNEVDYASCSLRNVATHWATYVRWRVLDHQDDDFDNRLRRVWDSLHLLTIVVFFVTSTYVNGLLWSYDDDDARGGSMGVLVVLILINVFWFVDLCFTAVLPSVDEYGRTGTALSGARRKAFALAIDVASALPLDFVFQRHRMRTAFAVFRFVKWCKPARLFYLYPNTSPSVVTPSKLFFFFQLKPMLQWGALLVMILHGGAVLHNLTDRHLNNPRQFPDFMQSVVTMTAALLGSPANINTYNNWERALVVLFMLVTLFCQGIVIRMVTAKLMTQSVKDQNLNAMRTTLSVLYHYNVPTAIQREVLAYQYHDLSDHAATHMEGEQLQNLPTALLERLAGFSKLQAIRAVPLFAVPDNPTEEAQLQHRLASALYREEHPPGVPFILINTPGSTMYILSHGYCEVKIFNGKIVATLTRNDFVGEAALFPPKGKPGMRGATVTSLTYIDTWVLDRKDFYPCVLISHQFYLKVKAVVEQRGLDVENYIAAVKEEMAKTKNRRFSLTHSVRPPNVGEGGGDDEGVDDDADGIDPQSADDITDATPKGIAIPVPDESIEVPADSSPGRTGGLSVSGAPPHLSETQEPNTASEVAFTPRETPEGGRLASIQLNIQPPSGRSSFSGFGGPAPRVVATGTSPSGSSAANTPPSLDLGVTPQQGVSPTLSLSLEGAGGDGGGGGGGGGGGFTGRLPPPRMSLRRDSDRSLDQLSFHGGTRGSNAFMRAYTGSLSIAAGEMSRSLSTVSGEESRRVSASANSLYTPSGAPLEPAAAAPGTIERNFSSFRFLSPGTSLEADRRATDRLSIESTGAAMMREAALGARRKSVLGAADMAAAELAGLHAQVDKLLSIARAQQRLAPTSPRKP